MSGAPAETGTFGGPERATTTAGRALAPLATGIAAALLIAALVTPYWLFILTSTAVLAITLSSIVLLTGFVGQPSLAQMTFAGFGAFFAAKLLEADLPFPLVIPVAAVAVAPVGVVVGLPALRIGGLHLALTTLGAALFADRVVFTWKPLTNYPNGLTAVRPGWLESDVAYFLFVAGWLALVLVLLARVRHSRRGRRWRAIMDNERGARAIGVDTAAEKLTAFAISASIAGLGGALYAFAVGGVNPLSFNMFLSLNYLAIVALVGLPYLISSVICAAWLLVVPEIFRGSDAANLNLLVVGLGLILVIGRHRDGVLGMLADRLTARRSPPDNAEQRVGIIDAEAR